jgi:cytochrome P450
MRGSQQEGFPNALLVSDPPRHRQLRVLVSKAFTPRRVEELTPSLTQIIDKLLERAIARGKLNMVTEFTHLLPVRVITTMLGLPPEDQERFHQWAYQLVRQMLCTLEADNNELIHYLSDLLNERKRNPRDDLMSALLAAEENGAHLTREDIINMCMEMIMAGNVTTTILLNHIISRLCRQPEIYQELRYDPSLIPGAIEETLRYDFTPTNVWRTARQDTVLNGHEIKAGQYVVAWKAAANFDETQFPHSEQFDIRRSPNHHLSFGHGIHYCLGAPLGRLEGRIALERFVAHFSEIHLDPENPAQYLGQLGAARIVESLGILVTPAHSRL